MDPTQNPFSPGAGTPPPELSGRQDILDKAQIALARLKIHRSEKSFLLVGLRGVGKTVLLNEINNMALKNGYECAFIEAHEHRRLNHLLIPGLRRILLKFDNIGVHRKVKRGLRILKSFLNSVKIKYQDMEINLDIDPERGLADTGDVEIDLPDLIEAVGEAAMERKTTIAIIVDELQYLSEKEISALILAIHRVSQRQLPVILIGAGLPQLIGLTGRSKSYAERLFDFPEIGPLKKQDAFDTLQRPVMAQGVKFKLNALKEIFEHTEGYPYFLQEWGYQSWNLSDSNEITLNTVKKASKASLEKLDKGFFRVRFDRLTPSEKKYLRALSEFGPGPQRSGDIADILGLQPQSVAPTRSNLIKKGMIYGPSHGDLEFTVPLFCDFMKRVMPDSPS